MSSGDLPGMEAGVRVRLARVGRFVIFAFARHYHHSLVSVVSLRQPPQCILSH